MIESHWISLICYTNWARCRIRSRWRKHSERLSHGQVHIWGMWLELLNDHLQYGVMHTSYLSFLLNRQDFRKPNFTPKKTTKGTKNTKNVSEKVIYMHFFHSFWKNLHLTENFYTDMSVVSVTNMRYVWRVCLFFFLRKWP